MELCRTKGTYRVRVELGEYENHGFLLAHKAKHRTCDHSDMG